MELQHFSHPHPLILNEEQEECNGEEVICFVCVEPILGRPRYECTPCEFFLHKRCAELPRKIKRHLHPEHPLLLRAKPSTGGYTYCELCANRCRRFVYHCSICRFNLDTKCAFQPCHSEAETPHRGQHQLIYLRSSFQLKSSSFTCNFCGTDGDGSPYLCTLCQLMFHEGCISLSETIKIRQHPHVLTYTFPQEVESEEPHCGVCQIQFRSSHGGYNCKDCNFFAHANCAKQYVITPLSEIQAESTASMDLSSTCTAPEVEHFSHQHSLIIIEEVTKDAKCEGCMLPISAPCYGCSPCNFLLHKACVDLPRSLPMEDLGTLYSRVDSVDGLFFCDLCFQHCHGFAYGFSWRHRDVRCAIKYDHGTITHDGHEHPLFLDYLRLDERCCSACGEACVNGSSFRCPICHFDLDFRCASLPREARHRYDEHPLLLTYIDPNDYQYVCQICEKQRDPKLWFYRCEECDFDAHLECALGKNPYVKLGNTQKYDFHPHPLAFVDKTEDYPHPKCSICCRPCDDLALECTDRQCNFIIHRKEDYGCMVEASCEPDPDGYGDNHFEYILQ